MNEDRYTYRTFANAPSSTDPTPPLVSVYDPDRITAAAKAAVLLLGRRIALALAGAVIGRARRGRRETLAAHGVRPPERG